eukprot:symbB.v1.2.021283.t1/scaffold1833.1/size99481/1
MVIYIPKNLALQLLDLTPKCAASAVALQSFLQQPCSERAATKRLQQLAKEKKAEQVADFLNSMEKSLIDSREKSLNVALKTIDTWPNAVALSLHHDERDLISLNTILNCCEEWQISMEFLQMANSHRNTVDTITYTTAMNALIPVTLWTRTLCLLTEMLKRRIQPNLVTWNTAVAVGHWKLTLLLFKHGQSKGICPDVVTYSTAAAAAELEVRSPSVARVTATARNSS